MRNLGARLAQSAERFTESPRISGSEHSRAAGSIPDYRLTPPHNLLYVDWRDQAGIGPRAPILAQTQGQSVDK